MPDANSKPGTGAVAAERYGFYGRLNAIFPSQVIIDTTEICNLACIHCPHPQFKKSDLYGGRCLDKELVAKAVDEVRMHGKGITQYIRFTGEGEPLIHPHVFEMLTYAVKNSGTTVTLTTNGSLMNEEKIEKLLATGIHVIDISIDAFTPETYAKVRVNGDLNITRANVIRLLTAARATSSQTKVVVSYVEQPLNAAETRDFEAFWKINGASFVVIRRLHSNAGASTGIADSLRHAQPESGRRPCLYPWERISLTPRGELIFCPQDWVHGSTVADYRNTSILSAWQSDFYRELREAHLKNQFANHAFCGNCPDWKQTRWPDEGRSYADMVQEFKDRE